METHNGFKVTISFQAQSMLGPLHFTQEINVVATSHKKVQDYFAAVMKDNPSIKVVRIETRGPILVL